MGCEVSLTYVNPFLFLFSFEFGGWCNLPDCIPSSPSRVPDIGTAFEGLLMLKLNLIAHAEPFTSFALH